MKRFKYCHFSRRAPSRVALAAISFAVTSLSLIAQTSAPGQSFDVASVKPAAPDTRAGLSLLPGRFVANGASLRMLIGLSNHLQAFQVVGGEAWMDRDKWSIEAKVEGVSPGAGITPPNIPDALAARIRSLLEDRFALRTHSENRPVSVYALTLAEGGSKMIAVAPPPAPAASTTDATQQAKRPDAGRAGSPSSLSPPPGGVLSGPRGIIGSALTMQQIVTLLNQRMDRPVIDKTGLTGYYDLKLEFTADGRQRAAPEVTQPDGAPAAAVPDDGPSIFTAIQEQLGLKLRSVKEPVSVLVIDSAQKPAAN